MLLESSPSIRVNRFYFTISRAKVWKILIFLVNFVAENSNKLQKLGLEGKISWAPRCVHIAKFGKSENVKNKKCVHTSANGTCYTSFCFKEGSLFLLFVMLRSPKSWCPPLCYWYQYKFFNYWGGFVMFQPLV
jgi:hypothetical protein